MIGTDLGREGSVALPWRLETVTITEGGVSQLAEITGGNGGGASTTNHFDGKFETPKCLDGLRDLHRPLTDEELQGMLKTCGMD